MKQLLRIILGVVWWVSFSQAIYARPNIDDDDKNPRSPKTSASIRKEAALAAERRDLNAVLKSLNYSFAESEMDILPQPVLDESTQASVKRAEEAFDKVKYIKDLAVLNQELPIGVKEDLGNTTAEVAISKLKLYPSYGEITVYVRLHIKDKNAANGERDIFFGAEGIKISNGGIIGDAKLVLLGDVTIPFGGNALILKGGFDEKTGVSTSQTYVTVDCKGFKEVNINGEFLFSRNLILPYNLGTGKTEANGQVKAKIVTNARSLDDILVSIDIAPFAVKGIDKWGFSLTQATFDFSDFRNISGANFPTDYFTKNPSPNAGNNETWRGVYIRSFKVIFPKELSKKDKSTTSLSANDLIFDRNGVSVKVLYEQSTPITALNDGKAHRWKMSLETFKLDIETNNLVGGGFGGKILLPISKNEDNKALAYKGYIRKGGEIELGVSTLTAVDFSILKATATLDPGSALTMTVKDGEIMPVANLSGKITIDKSDTEKGEKGRIEGLIFRKLVLKTEGEKISASYFGYQNSSKAHDFPISISEMSVGFAKDQAALNPIVPSNTCISDPANKTFVYVKLGGGIKLDDSFGGSAGVYVVGSIKSGTDGIDVGEFECLRLTELCIKTDFSAFAMEAGLRTINNGFEGKMVLKIKKPKEITVCASGRFSRNANGDSEWYVEGAVQLSPGIAIGPAVKLTSIAVSVYRRLHPVIVKNGPISGAFPCAACPVNNPGDDSELPIVGYESEPTIALGFKAVVGISTTGNAFTGSAGFEMIFNHSWGVSSIGLFGEGELAPKSIPLLNNLTLGNKLNNIIGKSGLNDLGANSVGKALSQAGLFESANTKFPDDPNDKAYKTNKINFRFGFLFDFQNDVFHGDADVYVSIAGGILAGRGRGEQAGRAGWLVMHFEPNKWYIHAGSPSDKIGLRFAFGPLNAQVGAYFMVGDEIPPMPPPPAYLVSMLNQKGITPPASTRDANALVTGTGLAFGADLSVSTGDMQFFIFYARLDAGLGFDLMLTKSAANCNGAFQASGQVYAYLCGEIGATFKVFGFKKKVHVFQGGAAVLLQGSFPNPARFYGVFAGRYSVLGGLVKGNFNMDVELGSTQCKSLN